MKQRRQQSGFLRSWSKLRLGTMLILVVGLLAAQDVPVATFSADVALVRLLVSVKDANGQPVGSLKKEDFKVFDTDVEQTISLFEQHTDYPLSISVLIDTSGSTNRDLDYEKDSVQRFLRALLSDENPDDAASLYAFNYEVNLLNSFTRREGRLRSSLAGLSGGGGTSMYDAIYLATRELDRREGRHVIVVVTDGGDTTSKTGFNEARREAQLADASIYGVLVVPIAGDAGRNLGGERALERLAEDTGGRVFTPNIGEQLDAAFAEILRDLRTQYLVGYYPQGLPEETPEFRPVRVEVKGEGLRAVTRTGYYGDSAE